MVKEIDINEIADAKQFRKLLAKLKNSRDQYILKESGSPQAALLSLDDLEQLRRAKERKEQAWDDLFRNMEEVHARNPDVSEEQVHTDIEEAIKAIRAQQR